MPIEVYDVQVGPDTGITPPATPAAADEVNGVPGAAPDAPATDQESAGAPPAPPSPSSGEDEGDESDDQQAVSLEDFNRHMARLRQRQRRAERALATERTTYQQELAQLKGQLDVMTRLMQGQPPDLGTPAQPPGPPQAEQYDTHDAYQDARTDWRLEQRLAADRQQSQAQQFQQQLLEREQAFKAEHPDYDERVNTHLRGKVAPHVQQALMMLPEGPALAYELTNQADLLARLNTLPPPLVFAELGRLSPPQAPPATTSTNGAGSPPAPPAPPLEAPLTPVNGQGSAPPGTWHEGMTQEQFRAWRARTSQQPRWQQQRRS